PGGTPPASSSPEPPTGGLAVTQEVAMGETSIKVGVIADQSGPLSAMGIANANVARMVIDDINTKGGLLGRKVDLYLEDGATIDSVAEAKATKLVQHDKVDVVFGGIFSSTRQAIKSAAVTRGRKLYIYPEQYEGQECDPLVFCTGPVPAQQVDPLIPWLMKETGAKKFYLPSAEAHDEQKGPSGSHSQRRRHRRRGVLPARSCGLSRDGSQNRVEWCPGGVQH